MRGFKVVAGKTFTIMKLDQHIREIVKRHPDYGQIRGEDAVVVAELFASHPDATEKCAGRRISHFEVRPHKFNTRALFAVFVDGSAIDFSWKKAIGLKA